MSIIKINLDDLNIIEIIFIRFIFFLFEGNIYFLNGDGFLLLFCDLLFINFIYIN